MPRDLTPTTIENQFVLKALLEKLRLDNREFEQIRNLEITFSPTEYGVVDVRLGRTRVIARISAEITQPYEDRPYDGIFMISTEFSPMVAPTFEVGRKSEDELLIQRAIEKSIRRSGALDTESLCIISGEKCWAIRADVHFLDHDGGLLDASCIAVIGGLLHFRRPDIVIEGVGSKREIIVYPPSKRVPIPLSVLHIPICVTFSFFDLPQARAIASGAAPVLTAVSSNTSMDNEVVEFDESAESTAVLLDTNFQEELLRHGYMSVTANTNREICQVLKGGMIPVDASLLLTCSAKALEIAETVTNLLKKKLKEDEIHRNVNNIIVEARAENER
ncbi:ribosomal protein S5 domain 2-type protein [Dipodascopsis uninucleata]